MEPASDMLDRIDALYHKSVKSEKAWGMFRTQKTVEGLEGIFNSELFSDRLWVTNARFGRKGRVAPPSRKATVMIIGNHSAGKSSFINWYTEEAIQPTGVALETSHFTMVTQGLKGSTVQSDSTTAMFPIFKELLAQGNSEVFPGFLSNIKTMVSASVAKHFPNVDFIDTPGLTDGRLNYECDVTGVIRWLAGYADLVFVFFDPVGQALCQRTLLSVRDVFQMYPQKIRFCLTKIDDIKTPQDFNKVLCQLSMGLSQSLEGRFASVEILPICLPDREYSPDKSQNSIHRLCDAIDKCTSEKVEQNLGRLKKDLEFIDAHLQLLTQSDNAVRSKVLNWWMFRVLLLGVISAVFFSAWEDTPTFLDQFTKVMIGLCVFAGLCCTFLYRPMTYSNTDRQLIATWKESVRSGLQTHQEMSSSVLKRIFK